MSKQPKQKWRFTIRHYNMILFLLLIAFLLFQPKLRDAMQQSTYASEFQFITKESFSVSGWEKKERTSNDTYLIYQKTKKGNEYRVIFDKGIVSIDKKTGTVYKQLFEEK